MKRSDGVRLGLAAVVLLLFVFSRTLAGWWTEVWWYQGEGYSGVFWTLLKAEALLGLIVGLLAAVALGMTSWIVLRGRSQIAVRSAQVLEFRRSVPLPWAVPFLAAAAVVAIAISLGLEAATHPDLLLNAVHAHGFGQADPLFNHDISFYVFRLPLIEYAYERAFVILLACLFLAVALQFASRSIQVVPDQFMVAPTARRQLLGIGGGLFCLKAIGYWLDTYGLLFQSHPAGPVLAGADYTDVHVRLPVYYLLVVLSLICAGSLWMNRLPRHWRTSLALVTVLVLVSFSGDVVLPVLTQRFVVKPNPLERETPYLQSHIKFTRLAYNLDHIGVSSFPAEPGFTQAEEDSNRATLSNIPLWDRQVLLPTLKQQQEIRQFYDFQSVDNDRYTIDGQYRQVMLAPRELSETNLPTNDWINAHFTYTHGYGLCMTAANEVDSTGNPILVVKNIPPQGPASLKIDKPQIYFGELSNDYCFVDTGSNEFDYPTNDQANGGSAYIHYDGRGGLPIASMWEKWLYFLRFGETNILFNSDIGPTSRVMFHRNIKDRVAQITPWVTYDADPYMVVSSGQLYWILDGYTTTSYFPYSNPDGDDQAEGNPLEGNYVRNSVKAVVNAFDGHTQFYISDPTDPIVATYAGVFPGVFQPLASMPPDLQSHLRYPKELFDIQAAQYVLFHMTDPQNFYYKTDLWQVAAQGGASGDESTRPMEPYYTMLNLKDKEEFALMLPFTPASKQNMVAWMAARCDTPHYGELVVYEFPRQRNIYGPSQIAAQLNQNPEISKSLTLWNQKGSRTNYGTLLVIPVGDSVLYVQPLYLSSEQNKMPQLIAVIISDGDRLAMGNNLGDALAKLLNQAGPPATVATPATEPSHPAQPQSGLPWKALVDQANGHMEAAETAQRSGDWAKYGDELKALKAELQEMKQRGGPP